MSKVTPESLMIYYGWLNSFNSATNGWSNEKVSQELARYDLLVFGDGLQEPTHGDYTNTASILGRIKELNPKTKIFGYVTLNQTISAFKSKTDKWNDLGVDGIFFDEAGYDYGNTRSHQNDAIDYVHSQEFSKICFMNAWNFDHILGIDEDLSYVNSTYNSDLVQSNLLSTDYALLESFAINTDSYTSSSGYENKTQWEARVEMAVATRLNFPINVVGSGIINDSNSSGSSMYSFGYTAAVMASLDGFGISDSLYGASSAKGKYYTRNDISNLGPYYMLDPSIVADGNKFLRYLDDGKLEIDFTSGQESYSIIRN